ncbi:ABC transporter ATP-binding protein [Salipiger sp. PrR003]|uniref:ABC transporter ATP-binding protein n=1 Tax=Salipiger sp. PrR003 TaxID=2706776 RepID=UPI0013DBA207|nr:oligopeptide/dipeptide ABC transporter ATP-binding protein [Salipiger sp. PrR003]NDV52006.1 ATP-binding cassette domain-containing protein [Salipiger sp. PrR003]
MSGLKVEGLKKHFTIGGGFLGGKARTVRAVENVSLSVAPGSSVGLVGESGCGKSTASRAILRLEEPTAGRVTFDGIDVASASPAEMRRLRQRMQFIFQDPYASLNSRRSIRKTLEEPLKVHGIGDSADRRARAEAILSEVGLPRDAMGRFPHEFSGGQRQRIGIARALVLEPDLVVADEPVSALDVSVQAQILRLLDDLREKRTLSFLFVSHDLGVIRHFCDTTCVMYLGHVVESGPTQEIMDDPAHPYTVLLRQSSPIPDPANRVKPPRIAGEIPSPANPPSGCPFHTRCPRAIAACRESMPATKEIAPGRQVACHLF